MSEITSVIALISVLFTTLLAAKRLVPKKLKFCAICMAVSLTWISLLILYYTGSYDNKLLLAILMGESAVGLYYLFEKKASEKYLVFRLPVLLSLTLIVFSVLSGYIDLTALALTFATWIVLGVMFAYRTNPRLSGKIKALIECCKDW